MKKALLILGSITSSILVSATLSCSPKYNPYRVSEHAEATIHENLAKVTDLSSTLTTSQVTKNLEKEVPSYSSRRISVTPEELGIDISVWNMDTDGEIVIYKLDMHPDYIGDTWIPVTIYVYNHFDISNRWKKTFKVTFIDDIAPTIKIKETGDELLDKIEFNLENPNYAQLTIKQNQEVTTEKIQNLFEFNDNDEVENLQIDYHWSEPFIDTSLIKDYELKVKALDQHQLVSEEFTLKIIIQDATKPQIKLDTSVEVGGVKPQETYTSSGKLDLEIASGATKEQIESLFSAKDNKDGDIILNEENFSWNMPFDDRIGGYYDLIVTVIDQALNVSKYYFDVNVEEAIPAPTFRFDDERFKNIDKEKKTANFLTSTGESLDSDYFNYDNKTGIKYGIRAFYYEEIPHWEFPKTIYVRWEVAWIDTFDGSKPGSYKMELYAEAPDNLRSRTTWTIAIIVE